MKFGLDFFPDCEPDKKSGQEYYQETLNCVEYGEELGYDFCKVVEHYFRPYGGYSPSPQLFLAAAAQRTKRMRLVTGCVLPVFSHPLKLAAELAMLDAISNGRLEVGVARAFLPYEFEAFGISMDESRSRFDEGVEALVRLWTEENVTFKGPHHSFENVTSLPKVTQKPHPPIWVAALRTKDSFVWAGKMGHNLMAIPFLSDFHEVKENIALYREARSAAGHPGDGRVMMVFHLLVDKDGNKARKAAKPLIMHYLKVLHDANLGWQTTSSTNYKGYGSNLEKIASMTFEKLDQENRVMVGSPDEVGERLQKIVDFFGPIEPSFQVQFGMMDEASVRKNMETFAADVMPRFR